MIATMEAALSAASSHCGCGSAATATTAVGMAAAAAVAWWINSLNRRPDVDGRTPFCRQEVSMITDGWRGTLMPMPTMTTYDDRNLTTLHGTMTAIDLPINATNELYLPNATNDTNLPTMTNDSDFHLPTSTATDEADDLPTSDLDDYLPTSAILDNALNWMTEVLDYEPLVEFARTWQSIAELVPAFPSNAEARILEILFYGVALIMCVEFVGQRLVEKTVEDIQGVARGARARRTFTQARIEKAAVVIPAAVRGSRARSIFALGRIALRRINAAEVLTAVWRGALARRLKATVIIQALIRAGRARRRFALNRGIQSMCRGLTVRDQATPVGSSGQLSRRTKDAALDKVLEAAEESQPMEVDSADDFPQYVPTNDHNDQPDSARSTSSTRSAAGADGDIAARPRRRATTRFRSCLRDNRPPTVAPIPASAPDPVAAVPPAADPVPTNDHHDRPASAPSTSSTRSAAGADGGIAGRPRRRAQTRFRSWLREYRPPTVTPVPAPDSAPAAFPAADPVAPVPAPDPAPAAPLAADPAQPPPAGSEESLRQLMAELDEIYGPLDPPQAAGGNGGQEAAPRMVDDEEERAAVMAEIEELERLLAEDD